MTTQRRAQHFLFGVILGAALVAVGCAPLTFKVWAFVFVIALIYVVSSRWAQGRS